MINKKVRRLNQSVMNLNKAEDKKRLAIITRLWVQDTPKIHALNYWYYRYFTNELELYILDAIKFEQTNEINPNNKTKFKEVKMAEQTEQAEEETKEEPKEDKEEPEESEEAEETEEPEEESLEETAEQTANIVA